MKIVLRPVTAHTPDEINVPHRVEIYELRWEATANTAGEALSRAYLAVLAHRGASSTDPAFEVEWRPAIYEQDTADGDLEYVEVRA